MTTQKWSEKDYVTCAEIKLQENITVFLVVTDVEDFSSEVSVGK